jgi:uncharacterized protein YabE (DUF348 family)
MLQAPAGSRFQQVIAWTTGVGLVILVVGLVTGLIPPPKHVFADSSRIVSIYYDGQEKVITTDATTVGQALQEAGVPLGQGDAAEPGVTTTIPPGFFNINVYRSRPVVVIDGSTHKTVMTAAQAPDLIAQAAGFTVYPEDTYDMTTINNITRDGAVGQQVVIHRAVPVYINSDGSQTIARTQQKTVAGLLNERDVALGPQDTVSPAGSTPITAGMVIQINRVTVVVEQQTTAIPFAIQTVTDPGLTIGATQVQTPGTNGQQVSTYRVHYQNGVEQGRDLLSQAVTLQPVTEVTQVGTKIDYSADPVQLGQEMAAGRGWVGGQWTALYQLWEHESGWDPSSTDFSSGACGIPQADPCSKLTDKSVAGQISWGLSYIAGKYGNPANAYAYWQSHDSY